MSVLIKDMNLPKDREILLRIDENGQVYVYGEYPTKLYKAIELPPHGRLIDVDEAYNAFLNLVKIQGGINPCQLGTILVNAPTIIEADDTRTPTKVMLDIADDVMMGESEGENAKRK